jgi:3-keto-disaccharide hydrolase
MRRLALLSCGIWFLGCGRGDGGGGTPPTAGSGGATGTGGASGSGAGGFGTGGTSGSGGATGTGGAAGSGGGAGSGGAAGTGGAGGETPDAGPATEAGPATPPGGIPTPAGLHPIFDGTTLNGWDGDTKIWSIKDGAIYGNTKNGGQLIVTKDLYANFRITGTARMPSSDNHLGVCFWGGTSGHGYSGCIDFVPPSGSIWDYGGGNGIRTYKYVWMGKPVLKTDWHQFEILANMKTGVVRMGVDGHEFPIYKDTRLARRKKAVIGLQIHAGASEVEYKDLAVETDPPDDKLLTTMGAPSAPM